jgi:hypothetical protein
VSCAFATASPSVTPPINTPTRHNSVGLLAPRYHRPSCRAAEERDEIVRFHGLSTVGTTTIPYHIVPELPSTAAMRVFRMICEMEHWSTPALAT